MFIMMRVKDDGRVKPALVNTRLVEYITIADDGCAILHYVRSDQMGHAILTLADSFEEVCQRLSPEPGILEAERDAAPAVANVVNSAQPVINNSVVAKKPSSKKKSSAAK